MKSTLSFKERLILVFRQYGFPEKIIPHIVNSVLREVEDEFGLHHLQLNDLK